ncbi:hypothetical protein [Rhizobium laguerreae]|nr:hypothetical protein [Rhizobium laguerreae]
MTAADSAKPIEQHFKRRRFPAEIIGHAGTTWKSSSSRNRKTLLQAF